MMCSGDQNIPQPNPSSDQNVPQHETAYFELPKRFMEAIAFTKTPWSILTDDKYLRVDDAWKIVIEAQDHQQALAGAPVEVPSVCQLPGGPSLTIDQHTPEAGSLDVCFMLLYQTYG
jgi:hypothetical protein